MTDFENQTAENGNICHSCSDFPLKSKEDENSSDPSFYALVPRTPNLAKLPDGTAEDQEPPVNTTTRIS